MSNEAHIQKVSEELMKLDVIEAGAGNYEDLFKSLSLRLGYLINHNFSWLVHLLYKLDISESKLNKALSNTEGNAADVIAQLIIDRQLEKIKSRSVFKKQEDIPEDERW